MLRYTLLVILLCLSSVALSNEAAPFSPVANERLARIQKKMGPPDINSPDAQKNLANYRDYLHSLYKRADYDFPKSLENYYRDWAERNGVRDPRPDAKLMADNIDVLHTLMKDMPAEAAFPGSEYAAVRTAYTRMRAAERGVRFSPEEIDAANKRRADEQKAKQAQLQKAIDARSRFGLAMIAVVTVVVGCLLGFLLWPVRMYLRRRKLAAEEKAAPYVYIQKHAKYPETSGNSGRNTNK